MKTARESLGMKVSLSAALVALVCIAGASTAEARRYEGSSEAGVERSYHKSTHHRRHRSDDGEERQSSGGRPRQWCGWWMRTQRGGGPEMNLAWNWSKWGRPSGPQVGAVVVWRHHVGEITGRTADGRWIVKSGNDGGQVRERARSVAGAVFRMG
jgi:hypothetical protein